MPAHPVEGIVAPPAVPGLFVLHSSAHAVQGAIGQRDHVKGIDHLGGLGQDHAVDRGVDVGHVEGAVGDAGLPGLALRIQKARHVHETARRQDVDDPVVLDVRDGRGVAGAVSAELHETRLVKSYGAGLVEAPAIGLEQGRAASGDGVVDGMPVTVELGGHLFDGATGADLERGPLGRSRGEQAVLGRDPVVAQDPASLDALLVHATHPVFLPGELTRRRRGQELARRQR